VIQPEVPTTLFFLYLKHGRWKIGKGATEAPDLRSSAHAAEVADAAAGQPQPPVIASKNSGSVQATP
jgi:hypothetical protein